MAQSPNTGCDVHPFPEFLTETKTSVHLFDSTYMFMLSVETYDVATPDESMFQFGKKT